MEKKNVVKRRARLLSFASVGERLSWPVNPDSKHMIKRKTCKSCSVWSFHRMGSQIGKEAACRCGAFLDGAS
jgi:hypothetical protein